MVNKAILNAYVRRIKRGTIIISDVPELIRDDVNELLKTDNDKSHDLSKAK